MSITPTTDDITRARLKKSVEVCARVSLNVDHQNANGWRLWVLSRGGTRTPQPVRIVQTGSQHESNDGGKNQVRSIKRVNRLSGGGDGWQESGRQTPFFGHTIGILIRNGAWVCRSWSYREKGWGGVICVFGVRKKRRQEVINFGECRLRDAAKS